MKTSSKTSSACGEAGLDVALAQLEVVADVRAGLGMSMIRSANVGPVARRLLVDERRAVGERLLERRRPPAAPRTRPRSGRAPPGRRRGRPPRPPPTGSPTKRTLSMARIGWSRKTGPKHGWMSVRSARSAPVRTAATPGHGRARGDVDRHDPGVRLGAAQQLGVEHARQLEVDRVRDPARDPLDGVEHPAARRIDRPAVSAEVGHRGRSGRSPPSAASASGALDRTADPDPDHLGPVPGRAAHVVERRRSARRSRRRSGARSVVVGPLADGGRLESGKRCGVSAAAPTATREVGAACRHRPAGRRPRRRRTAGPRTSGSRTSRTRRRCPAGGIGTRTPVTISFGSRAVS